MSDVERRLTATLDRVAAATEVQDRWAEVASAVPRRRRPRPGWKALAVGFAVVLGVVAAVPALVLQFSAEQVAPTAPSLVDDGAAVSLAGGAGPLPRLALDLPEATLVHANEMRLPEEAAIPSGAPGVHQYFAASAALAPPLLHVVSWTGPAETGPPDELAEVVQVRGRDAFLTQHGQFVALEWRDPDVSYVEIRAAGLTAGEVVALVEGMALRADPALGFDVAGLPAGVVPVYEGRSLEPDPAYVSAWATQVSYELDGGDEVGIGLALAPRPLAAYADAVFGAAWDAESLEPVVVREVPGVLARAGSERWSVTWREGAAIGVVDGDVALERLHEVLGAVSEVAEDEWRAMVAAAPANPEAFPEGIAPLIDLPAAGAEAAAAEVLAEACALAGRWAKLQDAERSDAAAQESAALAGLIGESAEALVGAPSGYGIVARRLAESVRVGDVAAVEAEFVGGGLGEPACAG